MLIRLIAAFWIGSFILASHAAENDFSDLLKLLEAPVPECRWDVGVTKSGPVRCENFSKQVCSEGQRSQAAERTIRKARSQGLLEEAGEKLEARINTVFPELQKILSEQVKVRVTKPQLLEPLLQKISKMRIEVVDCLKLDPLGRLAESASYHPPYDNTVKICQGFELVNSSTYALVFAIAHEMSHALDPLTVSTTYRTYDARRETTAFKYSQYPITQNLIENEYPFAQAITCLREPASTGIKKTRVIEDDAITETFADWMATEVLQEYVGTNLSQYTAADHQRGYADVFRNYCKKLEAQYLKTEDRIDRVLMAHPRVRHQTQCTVSRVPQVKYCSGK